MMSVAVAIVNREGDVVKVDTPTVLTREACAITYRVGECASTRSPYTQGGDSLSGDRDLFPGLF